jgi:glycosyltransferase involved in cell wall biosynthesis
LAVRLISFHHRLVGLNGHKYAEALGLIAAARTRGAEVVMLINKDANEATRAELPMAWTVLHCPVFRTDLSFEERTADFVQMLHRQLDGLARRNDRLLVTTGTQCEVRALAVWLRETPAYRRPWVVTLFNSDRWNRYGPDERERRVAEFRLAAFEIARLDADAKRRLIVGSLPDTLCKEVGDLLETTVGLAPMFLPSEGYIPPAAKRAGEPQRIGVMGGARAEKGSHLVAAIVRASQKLKPMGFVIQLANEALSDEDFAELCRLQDEPGVEVAHGPLDQGAYRRLLAHCDLLLLPYERLPYRMRASGIFIEAALTGRPVVVPSHVWMGDQVVAGAAAGVVYDGDDPTSIAEALVRAVEHAPALADHARRRAPQWERTMTIDAFLDWVEAEIGSRSAASLSDTGAAATAQGPAGL